MILELGESDVVDIAKVLYPINKLLIPSLRPETMEKSVSEYFASGWDIFGLVDDDSVLLGISCGEVLDNEWYLRHGIYVDISFQQNGFGRQLFSHLEAYARDLGCIGIKSNFAFSNEGAKKINEEHGYSLYDNGCCYVTTKRFF